MAIETITTGYDRQAAEAFQQFQSLIGQAHASTDLGVIAGLLENMTAAVTKLHQAAQELNRQNNELQSVQSILDGKFDSLFNGMAEGFALHEIICDDQGSPCDYRFLEINSSFETLTGLKREDVVGRLKNDVLPDDDPRWIEIYGKVALTGQSVHFENYSLALKRHYEVFAYCPAPRQFAVLFMDITERKEIEEKLKQSERLYRAIGESIDYGVWVCDADGRNIYASESFLRLVGITQQECSDFGWGNVLHPDDAERTLNAWKETVRTGGKWDIEHRYRGVDGQWHVILARGVPVRDEEGKIQYWAGINLDIDQLKQMENAIKSQAEKLQEQAEMLEQTHVLVRDMNNEIIYWNQGAEKLYGWLKAEAIGKVSHDLLKTVFPVSLDEVNKALSTAGFWEGELIHTRKDGSQVVVASYHVVHRDRDLRPVAIIEVNNDITPLKQAEEALQRAHDDLEKRVKERTQALILSNRILEDEIASRKLVEETLRQANAYNRSLIEASLDPLVTISPDGKISDANTATEKVTGYSRQELIGTYFHDYFTEPEKAQAGYRQVFTTGTVRDFELEIRHRDGNTISVLYNASVYHDQTGKVAGVFAAARDITQRKRAEEQLRLQTTALDSAANGVIITDPDGRILWANQAFVGMTGYGREEVVGLTPRILNSGKQSADHYQQMWNTILSGEPWQGEIVNRRKDGSLYFEEQTITPVRDEAGRVSQFIAIKQDITERKKAEQDLQQQEALLRTVLENLPVGVWLTDAKGNLYHGNPASQQIWAGARYVSLEEYGEYKAWWVSTGKPIANEEWAAARAIANGETSINEEIEIQCFDGSHKFILNSAIPMRDPNQNIIGSIVVNQDITDIRRARNALADANDLLETVFSSIDVLICYMDTDFTIQRVNRAYSSFAGHQPDFFPGKNQLDFLMNPIHKVVFQQVLETGEPYSAFQEPNEISNHPERGITYWDWRLQPVKDPTGKVQGLVLSMADVTERKLAEIARQESEERYTSIVMAMNEGIVLQDENGVIQTCNASAEQILGLSLDQMAGRTSSDPRWQAINEDGSPFPGENHPAIISLHTGIPNKNVIMGIHKPEGPLTWININTQPLFHQGNRKPYAVLSTFTDITERKLAETARQESEERYRSLVESSPDAILLADLSHRIQFANQQTKRLFRVDELDQLVGQNTLDWIVPEDRLRFLENAQVVLEKGVMRSVEYNLVNRNGLNFPAELNIAVVRNARGQPIAFHKDIRDITERKMVEAALEEERQRLLMLSQAERNQRMFAESLALAASALNSTLDPNDVLDKILEEIQQVVPFWAAGITLLEGNILHVARLSGFDHIPQGIAGLQTTFNLDDFPTLKAACASRQTLFISNIRDRGGLIGVWGWKWVRSYIAIPLQTREHVIGFLNIFFDTDTILDPEEIARLNAFANQASIAIQNARLYKELQTSLTKEQEIRTQLIQAEKFAALGRLLGSVAHELNNPLQTIKNCLFLTRQDVASDSPIQEYLDMASSETARLSNLVAQLRELYRPKAMGVPQPYPIGKILDEVHGLIGAQLRDLKVTWEREAQGRDWVINCVPDQIKQVFINISMNAVEAMQQSGGKLLVKISESEDRAFVGIGFQDTGPGISPEKMAKLFEPFFTTKASGMGLGLPICYELVQRHQGRIQVDSKENEGTTFTVWLPLAQSDENQ